MTWEQYYEELNKYARELKYKDAVDMREDLLDRTTNYFIKILSGNSKQLTQFINSLFVLH